MNFILFILGGFALGLRCCAGFSLVTESRGCVLCSARACHCGDLSCGAQALGTSDSVFAARRVSSCGLWALEHLGSSSCGTQA